LNADWQLQPSSPCINAGDITGIESLLPALDLASNQRINGIIDMGAYEYSCTSVPVSIIITASDNPVCEVTNVTFTATPANGDASPSYQWKKDGTNTGSNANTYSYTPVNGDIIMCLLTSDAACATGSPATSNEIEMTVTVATDVAETPLNKIKVYPNPAHNEINIEYSGTNDNITFEIINYTGQVVLEGKLAQKTVIQTGRLSPGIYIVRLMTGEIYEYRKFVKK
jgi:hypothetical protein